jgi:glycosyltransferase involved in cell wall biosynthesis
MNFALDLRSALVRPTGVGSYARALAERLPSLAPADHFLFFTASLRDRPSPAPWPENVRVVHRRLPVRALSLFWNRLGWPPLSWLCGSRIDLVHSFHPLLVPGGRQALHVITVPDLFFLKHPGLTRGEVRRDYAALVRDHARRADGVLCISEYTASEARRLLLIPDQKLAVTPLAADPVFRTPAAPEAVQATLARTGLAPGFVLYVGSDEPRKNLPRLLEAYRALSTRRLAAPPLVLLGPDQSWGRVRPSGEVQVRALGYLPDEDKRALLASAAMLVLPSLEEGFGIPILEAMSAGIPVVCSRGSAIHEVAGEAAVFVDPEDPTSIATAIESLLDDPALRASCVAAGAVQSRRFDWDATARQTLAFYRRLAAAQGRR